VAHLALPVKSQSCSGLNWVYRLLSDAGLTTRLSARTETIGFHLYHKSILNLVFYPFDAEIFPFPTTYFLIYSYFTGTLFSFLLTFYPLFNFTLPKRNVKTPVLWIRNRHFFHIRIRIRNGGQTLFRILNRMQTKLFWINNTG
jgi:hypothetical protein